MKKPMHCLWAAGLVLVLAMSLCQPGTAAQENVTKVSEEETDTASTGTDTDPGTQEGTIAGVADDASASDEAQTGEDLYTRAVEAGRQIRSSKVGKYGMTPIHAEDLNEGTWKIDAESNSVYFRITDASVTVEDGQITASFQISSLSYGYVYLGTKAQAREASREDWIPAQADETNEISVFTIPLTGLNQKIACAAYSVARDQWYDRTLVFDASSLPEEALRVELPDYDLIEAAIKAYPRALEAQGEDSESTGAAQSSDSAGARNTEQSSGSAGANGESAVTGSNAQNGESAAEGSSDLSGGGTFSESEGADQTGEAATIDMDDGDYSIEVAMTGGSGRASVSSPTALTVRDGHAYATLIWSSSHYDYMIVNGVQYDNTNEGGSSTFEIPVTAFDTPVMVIADTDAMGEPLEIQYAITFYRESIGTTGDIPQVAATRVLITGLILIIAGGVLNILFKRGRKRE